MIPAQPTTSAIAEALFNRVDGFILAFEIAAVLLLAAIIGAIVLVREK
jgi:NADH:ubiquinone oxidoreductase subunit 6 (subunit J)